jgi:hypothetical protein
MADERCAAEVSEPPWYIHTHKCDNRAKGTRTMRTDSGEVEAPSCGVHLRVKHRVTLFVVGR